MTTLRLFDTLTRETRPLLPIDGQRLRFYACGPTVYGPAHIGNLLTFVRCDLLFRTAKAVGLNPFYVRNITDVDDKTIRDATASGQSLAAFTEYWTARFQADCASLNCLPPDSEPRATAHIPEQVELVEKLLHSGHAYLGGDGSIYFRVNSFAAYGALSHFQTDELQTQQTTSGGRANDADEYEREEVADFALWKARKPADGANFWPGPRHPETGLPIEGRPGWHLECSAMSHKELGSSFDLHAGGEDLVFPHHENEIAQSRCGYGGEFARHWWHNRHLLVEGRKMSKSLGNFFTLADLLAKGHSPMAVRYTFLQGHYRQQLNFTEHSLRAAASAIETLHETLAALLPPDRDLSDFPPPPNGLADYDGPFANAWNAVLADLNSPAALGALFAALKKLRRHKGPPPPETEWGVLRLLLLDTLGLSIDLSAWRQRKQAAAANTSPAAHNPPSEITALAEERQQAKLQRNFAQADKLRETILLQGWIITDTREGFVLTPQNDPANP